MVNTGVPGRRQQYLLVLLCGPDASRAKAPSGARPMLPAGGQRPRGCPPALLFTGRRAVLPVPTSPSVCRQHFLTSSSLEERSQRSVTAPLYPPAGEVPWRRSSSLRPKCRRGGRGGLPGGICFSHQPASFLPQALAEPRVVALRREAIFLLALQHYTEKAEKYPPDCCDPE